MKKEEVSGAILLFLFGGVTVFFSLRMPIGTFRMAGTGLFPLCLGILLIVFSLLYLLQLFYRERKKTERNPDLRSRWHRPNSCFSSLG